MGAPTVASVEVVPVAGHDSMLLNLSGAHGPYFTRNVVIVADGEGRTGLGEVPGGDAIRRTIEDAAVQVEQRGLAGGGQHLEGHQQPPPPKRPDLSR